MQENQINNPVTQSVSLPAGGQVIQKQSSFLVILLSVLLLLSVLIAGFFAYQTQKLVAELRIMKDEVRITPTATIEPIATESVVLDTTNWKTYTSEKFDFSFKYPVEMSYVYDQSDQYVENGINNAMILVQNFDGSKPRTETESDFQIVVYISNKAGVFNLEDPQGEKTEIIINGVKTIKAFTTQKWVLVPTVFFQSSPNKIAVQLSNPKSTNKLWFDQIISTFKLIESENNLSRITFSSDSSVVFNKTIDSNTGYSTDVNKLSIDEYVISKQFYLKYYINLPESLLKNVFTDSNGNDAASGYYYDSGITDINGNRFSRSIDYYNPISITKSGKYNSSISSPISISCIYSYSNNRGYAVFSPLVPNAGADACDFITHLTDLSFISK